MKRWQKWGLGGIVTLALLTWAPCHNPSDAAAVIQRDESGEWVRQESTPFRMGLRLTASKSNGQTVVGRNGLLEGDPKTPAKKIHISRIWIINLSEGLLANQLGRSIQEDLLTDPRLDEVAYFPANDLPLQIRRPPHLFLVIDAKDSNESHWIGKHNLECDIQLYLGRHPIPIKWYQHEIRSGPEWNARVIENRKTWGILSRAFRFDDFVEETVEQLKLKEVVQEWRAPGMPDTPLIWAGPIPDPPDDLGWAQLSEGKLVIAQAPAPLLKEHTWIFPTMDNEAPNFDWFRKELESRGWSITFEIVRNGMSVLVAQKGLRTIRTHFPRDTDPNEWVLHHCECADTTELLEWLLNRETEGASQPLIDSLVRDLTPDQRADLLAVDLELGEPLREATREALR